MKLYSYYRSSAAYRVRIALNLKGVDYEYVPVNLLTGEHRSDPYTARNPQGRVPLLEDEGTRIAQSMAILEYLEERYPQTPILPADSAGRARVRQLANLIACDIHPLNNLGVLKYLKHDLGHEQGDIDTWYRHWICVGFRAFESLLSEAGHSAYCHGDSPTLADACLVPQVYNARRFDVDLSEFPVLSRINEHCLATDPFQRAAPENQPDTPASVNG
ncbi:MAG: maleylacetoacetate isomerase [Myxococcales bacterium]|nr:maleylacetoacetate isomerase [Myxococcales bacterium]